jgi:hypothetical protein
VCSRPTNCKWVSRVPVYIYIYIYAWYACNYNHLIIPTIVKALVEGATPH